MKTTDETKFTWDDCKDCFAVPGSDSIIDVIHPIAGRTVCFGKTLQDVQQEYPGAIKMTVDEYAQAKAARQDTPIEWRETTIERYDEMLNVLPPAKWEQGAFLVGEPSDHHATTGRARFECYRHYDGKYMVASRPMTVNEFNALFL